MANNYQGTADGIVTQTEFVPKIWAEGILKFFERKVVLRNLVDDYSSLVSSATGGSITIPEISLISSSTKTTNAGVSYDATHSTETTLTLDEHEYVGKIFEDILSIQANPDMVVKYVQMFGEALARKVDTDIFTQLSAMTTSKVLATDDVLVHGELQDMLATLGENDIDYTSGDVVMCVNPTLMADFLNPTDGLGKYFLRNDASGGSGLVTGQLGTIYGMPLIMSNTFTTDGVSTVAGAIFHKSAVACAVQQDVRVQNEYSIDALGTKVVADMIYGVKVLDDSDNIRGIKIVNTGS